MSSTTAVPETVTLTLSSDDVLHSTGALEAIVAKSEEHDHPAHLMARGIIDKLPESGGEVELSLVEAFRLEKGVNIVDSGWNMMALVLGAFEPSATAESLRSQIDSALEGTDPDEVGAVAERQGEEQFAELSQLAGASEAA